MFDPDFDVSDDVVLNALLDDDASDDGYEALRAYDEEHAVMAEHVRRYRYAGAAVEFGADE